MLASCYSYDDSGCFKCCNDGRLDANLCFLRSLSESLTESPFEVCPRPVPAAAAALFSLKRCKSSDNWFRLIDSFGVVVVVVVIVFRYGLAGDCDLFLSWLS